jgi:hypothetical protein
MQLIDYIMVTKQLLPDAVLHEIRLLMDDVAWNPAITVSNAPNYRTCSIFPISLALRGAVPVPPELVPRLQSADDALFKVVAEGGGIYNRKFPRFAFKTDSGYEALRYETGQFYKKHTDDGSYTPHRTVAFSLGLNNDYEGGGFSFFDAFSVRIKAGHAIMFPANFMFPHEIKPVTAGTRYSMITWLL